MLLKSWTKLAIPISPKREKRVSTEAEARRFFQEFAKTLSPRAVVWLEGSLGAGKSTAARWMMEALGVKSLAKGSPTFSVIHEYSDSPGYAHVDLYRIQTDRELRERAILDYLAEWPGKVFIEWGSQFPETCAQWALNHSEEQWLVSMDFDSHGGVESRLITVVQKI